MPLDPARSARALTAVVAPVTAEIRDAPEDVVTLCELALSEVSPTEAHTAALTVIGAHLRFPHLDPVRVVAEFGTVDGRFPPEVFVVGSGYLRAASVVGPLAQGAQDALLGTAAALGPLTALRGAVAGAWWALLQACAATGRDPLVTAQRLCLQLSALDPGR